MKVLGVIAALATAICSLAVVVWIRERRARTVFPASQAASLLHPARRWIQPSERIVAAFDIGPGQRVLEVGPGPGYFTAEAARATGASGRIVCVDLQPAMIRELRVRLPADVAPSVRLLAGDAVRLPFGAATFDRAFLVAVLGETPDAARVIAELRRVLRPGGAVSFCETLTDPDYVREGTLRRLAWAAGLQFSERRRQTLGYVVRFVRP